eukprot:2136180-Pyramimonas_sp.AAC.1
MADAVGIRPAVRGAAACGLRRASMAAAAHPPSRPPHRARRPHTPVGLRMAIKPLIITCLL